MEPTLREGDRLLVRWRSASRPATVPIGALAVVRLSGGRPLAIKRVTSRQDGGWWVERDSPLGGVDSWTTGAIPDRDLLAIAVARLWPRPRRLRAGGRGAAEPGHRE